MVHYEKNAGMYIIMLCELAVFQGNHLHTKASIYVYTVLYVIHIHTYPSFEISSEILFVSKPC